MKRKRDLEFLTYWKMSDTEQSNPDFLEYGTYEEIWSEDLPEKLLPLITSHPSFFLSFTSEKEIVFTTSQGEILYTVSVPDLKRSSFLTRFLEYGDTGTVVSFTEQKIKGRVYNKMIFQEERGSDENMVYLDRDCPKCMHLLEQPSFKDNDEPEIITCSNFDCKYIDDSKADYSKNLNRFNKEVAEMRQSGSMEITGTTKEDFILKQKEEHEDRICENCSGGVFTIENVFIKKEHGEKVCQWFSKCNHCHHMHYSYQLSKNDPLTKVLFGFFE